MRRYTIAVIGSDNGLEESGHIAIALGRELAKKKVNVITGAGRGLPLKAAAAAKKAGGRVYGISPWDNARTHNEKHPEQEGIFDFIFYSGLGMNGRNVMLARSVDALIMVGGAMGTLNEFTIAFDHSKIIGVLEGSGGFSEMIRRIAPLGRDVGARIVYSNDPKKLVGKICKMLKEE